MEQISLRVGEVVHTTARLVVRRRDGLVDGSVLGRRRTGRSLVHPARRSEGAARPARGRPAIDQNRAAVVRAFFIDGPKPR
jgi:hypothetical protein